ncbi:MAG: tRNA (N6-isopentenyl adenosine(37)-C2)-methylthiotransferase MiaB [Spirochaetaceae bacterium]|jgi:tRNA-2-methylthio-N6-dimethylallyladenosine synthase|nr:tRNA (N6-isopentenyl adenosine(37)-C2)-methylthiotransferase MiaB [Spirochaetaceae bacterium]
MTYLIETYGCQMNAAESAALKKIFAACGWEETADADAAHLVVLNTCAVRETAEERFLARLAIHAARKKMRAKSGRPLAVAVAGCVAERLGDALKERGADFVLGAKARGPLEALLARWGEPENAPVCRPPFGAFYDDYHVPGSHKSFVPIMNGCNNFCSYCIVPYVRGREVSRSPSAIIAEIDRLANEGVREITLLGQNVNSYHWTGGIGQDKAFSPRSDADFVAAADFAALTRLVAQAVEDGPIRWVRFLSSHPKNMTGTIIKALAGHPCFCRHIHLPVQHGSNRILAAMNRRYTREDYCALVRALREAMPGVTLSTDILVGFPGETEEDVEAVLSLMDEVRFLYAYMYHYNPREGTAAYGLPGRIPDEVKKARLARIIETQGAHTVECLKKRLGSRVTALVEGPSRNDAGELLCRTEHDEQVVVKASGIKPGEFIEVSLDALAGNTFRGTRVGNGT